MYYILPKQFYMSSFNSMILKTYLKDVQEKNNCTKTLTTLTEEECIELVVVLTRVLGEELNPTDFTAKVYETGVMAYSSEIEMHILYDDGGTVNVYFILKELNDNNVAIQPSLLMLAWDAVISLKIKVII